MWAVFQLFLNFFQENPAMAVAIKTCKNCTSDSVREKFLQEACEYYIISFCKWSLERIFARDFWYKFVLLIYSMGFVLSCNICQEDCLISWHCPCIWLYVDYLGFQISAMISDSWKASELVLECRKSDLLFPS